MENDEEPTDPVVAGRDAYVAGFDGSDRLRDAIFISGKPLSSIALAANLDNPFYLGTAAAANRAAC